MNIRIGLNNPDKIYSSFLRSVKFITDLFFFRKFKKIKCV
ncbi:hypothetical protein ZPR_0407 [Zunongwangia profunda SM-A87]|uniref:Uncharacterized protein n=1 Tax=Zunongwangia profunda (strain DSM 18752 / CCTCC AB 206139 / SM-A87) TaxID=655815 RepID=D5BEN7_ZUNPS|nr:hypothetical protein ZPR_0407 [Zunongwangia profunda SM-A87]